jgi:hypothetical protein
LLNWEYWPFCILYGPILIYWLYLSIKARSFFFFNTSNPTIGNGGFMMESKWDIYKLLPKEYYPNTLIFKGGLNEKIVTNIIKRHKFHYPLIGKPDIGLKGMSVKKLESEYDLIEYVKYSKVHFLIQEFVPYPNEVGIFYYRYPNQQLGHISGIVSKEFLSVKGTGYSTIKELLQQEKRYVLQLPILARSYGEQLNRVLVKGEELILVPYGNHVRGAKFIDASDLIDERLTETIDEVCKRVDGFFYGRLDIRYNTWEELREGKNFSIIELNGAGSEPTHIYDPKHSILFAWKEIIRHWTILWKISRMNHHKQARPYMKTISGLKMLRENNTYIKKISETKRA